MDKKWNYGTKVFVKDGRKKPWLARLNLGYDSNGYPITHILDSFEDELDCILCLRQYSNSPYDIYIDKNKYHKITTFVDLPSKVLIKENYKVEENILINYTFKEVYEEYSKLYFPTEDEILLEKKTHTKTQGKLSADTMYVRKAAFKKSKSLYDIPYKNLRTLDFQQVINTTKGSTKTLIRLRYLFEELDELAEQKDIINKGYARYVKIDNIDSPQKARIPFSDTEVHKIWSDVPTNDEEILVKDIILILLYTGLRIDELLNALNKNVLLDLNYFITGSKTESGKNRIIPIHHLIKPIIKKYFNVNNEFLINYNGTNLEYPKYRIMFNKFMNKLNMQHTRHDARHSVVTELDNKNANLKCRNLILGHKSKNIGDEVYNKKTLQDLINTIELIKYDRTIKKNVKLVNNVLIYDDFIKNA